VTDIREEMKRTKPPFVFLGNLSPAAVPETLGRLVVASRAIASIALYGDERKSLEAVKRVIDWVEKDLAQAKKDIDKALDKLDGDGSGERWISQYVSAVNNEGVK